MTVIANPEQITPRWLNEALQQAGYRGEVTDFSWQSIGAGQVGDNARLDLQGSGDIPASLVAKFPSADPVSKQTGVALNNYAREVFFYRDLAPTVDIQTPRVFATEFDPASHDFIILMEDLAPGIQVAQMDGCSAERAELAIVELAKLHGPRWDDATLREHALLNPEVSAAAEDSDEPGPPLYTMFQDGFLQRYQARLDDAQQQMVRDIGQVQDSYADYQGPQTLIHIDYRLDNMIFGGPYPLAILDWQSINLGCALVDVAYFLGTSLLPETRREFEQALLATYLETLRGYDVQLDEETCWQLYRHYAPAGLNMAVIASMIVGETERGNDMFMAMAERSIIMCQDLQTVDLLAGG